MRNLLSGDQVGKFHVVSCLGQGGMGVVYLAEDQSLGRSVALKSLHAHLAGDENFLRRFEFEAKSIGKLFHPNIVPINNLIQDDSHLIIEMPYLEGGSLADQIEMQGLLNPAIVSYAGSLLSALADCHALNMVHRDVKPSNILFDLHGRPMLTDFGIAKIADAAQGNTPTAVTQSNIFMGTPRYAPLEAWELQEATPAWDVFSVGVILYEGLSGQPVFQAETPLGYMRCLEKQTITPLASITDNVSKELCELVDSMLAVNAEDRCPDAGVAHEVLRKTPEHIARADTIPALPIFPRSKFLRSPWDPREVLKRTIRIRMVTGVLVLLVLIGVFLGLLYQGGFHPREENTIEHRLQSAAYGGDELQEQNLLSTWRSSEAQVYREIRTDTDSMGDRKWVLTPNLDGHLDLIAFNEHTLILGAATSVPDNGSSKSLQGIWGGYSDTDAMECIVGVVSGTLRELEDGKFLLCTVEFFAENLGRRWTEQFVLAPSAETDTSVLWSLEDSPLLLPLLHNELIPRDNSWTMVYTNFLPVVLGSQLKLPKLGVAAEAMDINGVHDEHAWKIAAVITAKDQPGIWSQSTNTIVRVFMGAEGVYMLIELEDAPTVPMGIKFHLAPDFYIPMGHSPTLQVTVENDEVVNTRLKVQGEVKELEATLNVKCQSDDGNWTCEIFIPLVTGGEVASVLDTPFWRMNIVAYTKSNGTIDPIAIVGAPDLQDVQHGLLLNLDTSEMLVFSQE